jgi:hypothetical protein
MDNELFNAESRRGKAATKEFEQEQTEETEAEKFCQECAILGNSTAESQCNFFLLRVFAVPLRLRVEMSFPSVKSVKSVVKAL